MTDPDYAAAAATVAAEPPPANPYEDAGRLVGQATEEPLARAMYAASKADPERHAKVLKIADQWKLDPGLVDRNYEYMNGWERYDAANRHADFATIFTETPALARWLMDQDNAKIAQDDIPTLKRLHRALDLLKPQEQLQDQDTRENLPWFSGVAGRYSRMGVNAGVYMAMAPLAVVENGIRSLVGAGNPEAGTWWSPIGQIYQAHDIMAAEDRAAQTYKESLVQKVTGATIQALSNPLNVVLPVAGGMAARGAAAGAGILEEQALAAAALRGAALVQGTQAGGQALADTMLTRQKSGNAGPGIMVPTVRDLTNATAQAALGYITGKAGGLIGELRTLNTGAPPTLTNLPGDIIRNAVQGGTQSAAAAATQNLIMDGKSTAWDDLLTAYVMGAVPGGVLALGNLPQAALAGRAKAAREVSRQVHTATTDAQILARAGLAFRDSATAIRSPERASQLVQDITGGNKGETTYFQSDDWRTYWQESGQDPAGIAAAMGVKPEDYAAAMARGGTLAIDTGKYLAATANTEHFAKLLDVATLSPDGMNLRDANTVRAGGAKAIQQLQTDVRTAMTQVHGDEHANRVYEDVRQKLVDAGQPEAAADQEALLISAWHKTVAERFNKDPNTPDAQGPVTAWDTYTKQGTPALDIKQDTTIRIGDLGYDRQSLASVLETAIGDVLDVQGKAMSWAKDQQGNALVSAGHKKTVNAAKWFTDSQLRGKGILAIVEALRAGDAIDWNKNQSTRYVAANVQRILAQHVERFGNAEQFKAITPEEEATRIAALDEAGAMFQKKDTSPRGSINFPPDGRSVVTLFENRDRSTFLHETGHYFLNQLLNTAEGQYSSASVRADAAEVMKWLGIEDRKSLATEHHERFARSFEQYLMEGKAPSASLMGAFRTFKRWLMTVYASIRGDLKTGISPEIRRTFDRMLATDEEIAAAKHARGGEALYENAEQAGMDAPTWAKYQEAVARTTQDARDRMERELIAADLEQQSRERKAVRDEIRSAVESRIDEDPAHRLISALQDGTAPDGTPMEDAIRGMKLDRAELVARYGQAAVDEKLPGPGSARNKGRSVAADKGGISLDAAAAIFGYPSGDDVWHALVDTPDRRQAIEQATEQELSARFPDPLNDPAIGQKAEAAMHHELRGQLLAREVDALARQVPGSNQPAPIELLRAAARNQVMRTRAIELNPWGFALAERRAAKAARDAVIAGDRSTALAEKQRELLNHELYILAREADEEVQATRRYLATFSRPATRERIGKAGGWEWTVTDPTTQQTFKAASEEEARRIAAQGQGRTWERTNGYLEKIDGILDGIEFAMVSRKGIRRRLMLSTWIAEQQAMGLEPAIAPGLVNESSLRNWRLLTTDELLGVRDSIQSIEHVATIKNELLADAQKRSLGEAADAIAATVFRTSGGRIITKPQSLRGIEGPGDSIARFGGAMRRLTDLLRNMDGHQDGGALFDHFLRPLNEAADREATMQAKAMGELDLMWKSLGERRTGTFIDFRQRIPGASERVPALSTEERLGVALNWGTASNRERILTGHQWSEADVQAILNTLTKNEMDYVQGVWDHVNSYWSEIKAQEQRLTGVAPSKLEAVPIFTKHGKYRGGYYPAKYDTTQSASASEHVIDGIFREGANGQPTTRHGFTKERELAIEPGVKLRLDQGVLREHIAEVIHDITHRATLIDAARILRQKVVKDSISKHYGVDQWEAIRDTLMAVAKGDQAAHWAGNKAANWMRAGGSISAFAYNATSALSQITGIAQSAERLGLKWMFKGIQRSLESPLEIADQIQAKSEFMANRARTFNRDIRELGSLNLQEKGKFYWMMQKMQAAVDIPTWLGAYEKARSEGHDDKMAVSIADQTVVDTQGGGRIHDLAPIMRGGPLAKLFTQFASFPNVAANLLANSAQRNGLLSARFVGSAATLVMFQAVSTWALKALMKGDWPEDGEALAKKLAKENASFLMGMVIGGRELSGPILEGRAWTGPAGTRGIEALGRLAMQSEQGDMDRQLQRAIVDSVGIFGHLPSVQTWRIIDGLIAPGDRDRSLRAALFGRPAKAP